MKLGYLVVVAALLSGCAVLPTVYHSSNSYPRISADESQRLSGSLERARQAGKLTESDYRSGVSLLSDVQNGRPLSENQLAQLARLKSVAARQRDDERRIQEQRRQQLAEKKRQDDEAARKVQYRSDFEAIATPEAGTAFVQKYADFDPDKLAPQAKKRGYDREIQQKKDCIDQNNRVIAHQQQLAAGTGPVDRQALNYARANQLVCKKRLMQLLTECSRGKLCR